MRPNYRIFFPLLRFLSPPLVAIHCVPNPPCRLSISVSASDRIYLDQSLLLSILFGAALSQNLCSVLWVLGLFLLRSKSPRLIFGTSIGPFLSVRAGPGRISTNSRTFLISLTQKIRRRSASRLPIELQQRNLQVLFTQKLDQTTKATETRLSILYSLLPVCRGISVCGWIRFVLSKAAAKTRSSGTHTEREKKASRFPYLRYSTIQCVHHSTKFWLAQTSKSKSLSLAALRKPPSPHKTTIRDTRARHLPLSEKKRTEVPPS